MQSIRFSALKIIAML